MNRKTRLLIILATTLSWIGGYTFGWAHGENKLKEMLVKGDTYYPFLFSRDSKVINDKQWNLMISQIMKDKIVNDCAQLQSDRVSEILDVIQNIKAYQ